MSEARDKYLRGLKTYECEYFGCQAEKYVAELEQQISGSCKWKYDENYNMYETDCENAFIFNEGRKSDNEFLFCPYCGKKIEEVLK